MYAFGFISRPNLQNNQVFGEQQPVEQFPSQEELASAFANGISPEVMDDIAKQYGLAPATTSSRPPCNARASNVLDNAPDGFSNIQLGIQTHSNFGIVLTELTGTQPRDWEIRTGPGQNGVDATYIGDDSTNPGFENAELKPYSQSGIDSFIDQLDNWDDLTPGQTQLFFYNKGGTIGSSGFNF